VGAGSPDGVTQAFGVGVGVTSPAVGVAEGLGLVRGVVEPHAATTISTLRRATRRRITYQRLADRDVLVLFGTGGNRFGGFDVEVLAAPAVDLVDHALQVDARGCQLI
jgi:hypothetical protein